MKPIPEELVQKLISAAQKMPRKTPDAGGASTIHNFKISASSIWALDEILTEIEKLQPNTVEAETLICTCQKTCDCENPEPDNYTGPNKSWVYSNQCPLHNTNPDPNLDCPIHGKMSARETTTVS